MPKNQVSSVDCTIFNFLKPRSLFLFALSSTAQAYNLINPNDGIKEHVFFPSNQVANNNNGFFPTLASVGTHYGHTTARPAGEPLGSTCIDDGYGRVFCK